MWEGRREGGRGRGERRGKEEGEGGGGGGRGGGGGEGEGGGPIEIRRKKKKKKQNLCGGVTCPEGRVCCPDQRCGPRCCANGRACEGACCGPNGNDYCCDETRPMCICGGCWQTGSTQCDHPDHCCSPGQRCCGAPPYDHCCAEGWECKIGCGGIPESATCCLIGAATCCPLGHAA